MRQINLLVIHCSATKENQPFALQALESSHRKRGFYGIGYHYYIRQSGEVINTRPLSRIGAHAKGYNRYSIGICYEGGLDKDGNGNYRITGRIKDMIIRGGENIYPREIEEFLYKLEGIKDVQVAGIPSKRYGEAVGAFIILHEGVEMNEFDVREFCEGKIARYKIPKYIFFVKEFPMTGSGKIQKYKLKDVGLELCAKQGIEII